MNLQVVNFKVIAEQGNYVYCYLRAGGTPYYVGIASTAERPLVKHRTNRGGVQVPRSRERIRVLRSGLTREEACDWEVFYIKRYGRKDLGTGILRNRTDGGDNGALGYRHSEEWKKRIAAINTGRTFSSEAISKMQANANRPEHIERLRRQCFTPEAIEKRAVQLRGVKRPEEVCTNISAGKVEGAGHADKCGFTTEEWLGLDDNQRISVRSRIEAGWSGRETLLLPSSIRLDVLQSSKKLGVDPVWYSGLTKNKQGDLHKRYQNWEKSGQPKNIDWETWKGLSRRHCNSIARCEGMPWALYGITLMQYLLLGKAPKNKLQWRYKNGKRGSELLEGVIFSVG